MQNYAVFHAARLAGATPSTFPDGYRLVAIVESPDRDAVFELTNHAFTGWHERTSTLRRFDPGPRSTSVGDVVLDESDTLWACAPIGWSPLPEALGKRAREIVDEFPEAHELIVLRDERHVVMRTRHPMLRMTIQAWASAGTGRVDSDQENPDYYGHPAADQYPPNPPPDIELTEWKLRPSRAANLVRLIDHALSPAEVARYYDTDTHGEERAASMVIRGALATLLRTERDAFAAYRDADNGIITAEHAKSVTGPSEEGSR
jgi:hypothetical protein